MSNWIRQLENFRALQVKSKKFEVRIVKPKPWYGSQFILQFAEQGHSEMEIARRTGYSIDTVRRTLKDRGEHASVGVQCDMRSARTYTISEAFVEQPLPCGPNCICEYTISNSKDR
jgi:hypothetical protein